MISLLLQVSIPAWFTVDTRLGSLSVHLDTPQCFSAEMYSVDLNIVGKPEDDKVAIILNSFLCLFFPLFLWVVFCDLSYIFWMHSKVKKTFLDAFKSFIERLALKLLIA